MHRRISMVALVALGGAAGAVARAGVAAAMHAPWATLTVNLVGAFVLGGLLEFFTRAGDRPAWRLLLGTGFCGAFTTYSTFAREVAERSAGSGVGLAVAEVALGLVAAAAGAVVTARWAPRSSA
ncbi:putative protein CrcB [Dermacoccus sp. Ellin185]|nr:putative protein CrcB [Dermacoccus sp. Ellin185]